MTPLLVVAVTEPNHTLVDVDTGFFSSLILSKGKAPFAEARIATCFTFGIAPII